MPDSAAVPPAPATAPVAPASPTRSIAPRWPLPAVATGVVCAVLLAAFWVRAQSAITGKSSTYDEPMHALGAWVHWHHGDWRINYEDPPLWHYWAALPNGHDAIKADFSAPRWRLMIEDWNQQWLWTVDTLYRTPGNDGEVFVQRSRSMMIVVGVALGALTVWWGWRVGGAVAAVAVAVLFTLDPNFLAHAALVKNDVAMALCTVGLCLAVWSMGVRVTPWNLAGAAAACAAAMSTKFSGVLLAPLFATLLLVGRAAMPWPWVVFGRTLGTWWQRVGVSIGALLVIALVSYAGVWASYGFSFPAMPDPKLKLNTKYILDEAKKYQAQAAVIGRGITPEQERDPEFMRRLNEDFARRIEEWKPDGVLRSLQWMLDKRLFPEAWINGLMFVHARSQIRGSFLDGEHSPVGFRGYFPLAMAYKTPLATLGAMVAALSVAGAVIALSRLRGGGGAARGIGWEAWWLGACLLVPVAVYLWVSIRSNLNIGFRHVLPVYPLLFVAVGWGVSAGWRRWRRPTAGVAGALAVGLAAESLAIAPDYITFFNAAAGGQRGGLFRLADSNLDWGQDLPQLAAWQRRPENRDVPLYLSYFGMADPAAYGIRYLNMPGGWELSTHAFVPPEGAVVAISATKLQGVYGSPGAREFYGQWKRREPTEVFGGSIYLFDGRKPSGPAAASGAGN